MRFATWGTDVLDLLLPAGCVACKAWVPGGAHAPLVCGRCMSRLREAPWPRCPRCHFPRGAGRVPGPDCLECRAWPPSLASARYVYVLAPPAEDLVHALKYEGWSELADLMGDRVARLESTPAPVGRRSAVVPMPTTPERLRGRGYNQAELLARRVAGVRELPMHRAISRAEGGRSQTSLTPAQRRENVRGVFRPSRGADRVVAGADVLLVDDVLTTGATASEAATTLVEMGAETVTLLAFARALPTPPRPRP